VNRELLFSMAFGLQEPWQIKAVEFELTKKSGFKELHLHIGVKPAYQSPDKDGIPCPVHDTVVSGGLKVRGLRRFENVVFS